MVKTFSELSLECLAIGSLPHNNLEKAMELVKENFKTIPFWPQLAKINKNEDMIVQFIDNMPSFFIDGEKTYLETESDKFFEDIEEFFADYEEIISDINCDAIEKYAIKSSLAFPRFLEIVKDTKPKFAKGQVVGPFTLATTLVDKSGKCAFYDDTLTDIILKTLTVKALWQIKHIKSACQEATPIIFIDEPTLSQLGTSAFISVSEESIIEILQTLSDIIKQNGAMSAIHCCGKCNWSIPVRAGVDIINFDAYSFSENLSLYSDELKPFLESGGKIAWGLIPTLDADALSKVNKEDLISVFENALNYLTKKGIDEKIIIENSLITPSCGAGSLNEELAAKAMRLTKELSDCLKERYYDI